jgi:hypothetical protein
MGEVMMAKPLYVDPEIFRNDAQHLPEVNTSTLRTPSVGRKGAHEPSDERGSDGERGK